ncbi:MAG: hypothetical protein NTY01_09225 [Verrucomicrobia bacterium]|nr:hypothetical protein [Verrucomicrobiota bacterium]
MQIAKLVAALHQFPLFFRCQEPLAGIVLPKQSHLAHGILPHPSPTDSHVEKVFQAGKLPIHGCICPALPFPLLFVLLDLKRLDLIKALVREHPRQQPQRRQDAMH